MTQQPDHTELYLIAHTKKNCTKIGCVFCGMEG